MIKINCVFILCLSCCASSEPKPTPAKKIVLEKSVVIREPGAIWTELSHWNHVFTDIVPRKSGDMLRVKYTDSFRELMMNRLKRELPKNNSSAMDETDLAVQISEVHSGGLYEVHGDRRLKFADDKIRLRVTATIREKDIKTNDSVTWDELYNLQWTIEADKT